MNPCVLIEAPDILQLGPLSLERAGRPQGAIKVHPTRKASRWSARSRRFEGIHVNDPAGPC